MDQSWYDSWLSYSRDASVLYVSLNSNLHEKIWTPDTTLRSTRNLNTPDISETSVRVFANGLVQMEQK